MRVAASASRLKLTFTGGGDYRFSLEVEDGLSPAKATATVDLTVVKIFQRDPFLRGDCNQDGAVDLGDALRNLFVLFGNEEPSSCPDACDANDDEALDVSDTIALLNYLYAQGRAPPEPFTEPGVDPAGDDLECSVQ